MYAASPVHLIPLDVIIIIILGEDYKFETHYVVFPVLICSAINSS
jgi:hypothetical protein